MHIYCGSLTTMPRYSNSPAHQELDGAERIEGHRDAPHARDPACHREFCIDNLLVRIHFIIVMIRWTGLAPFPFPGSLTSTYQRTRSSTARSGSS